MGVLQYLAGAAIEVIIFTFALGLVYRVWGGVLRLPKRQTVLPFQKGAVIRGESTHRILGPGRHWILPKETLFVCDMRAKPFQIGSVEFVTADQRVLRLSVSGEYQISDPAAFLALNSDAFSAFYLEIRKALYRTVRSLRSDTLAHHEDLLIESVTSMVSQRSAELGIEMRCFEIFEFVLLGRVQTLTEFDEDELPVQ